MHLYLLAGGILAAAIASLIFSSLSYSLRDFSRPRLEEWLQRHRRPACLPEILDHTPDHVLTTAVLRLLANILILVLSLALVQQLTLANWTEYLIASLFAGVICLFVAVAIPQAIARHVGEPLIGALAIPLRWLRLALSPLTALMHGIDAFVARAAGTPAEPESEQIEQEILSVVEEGEKEGVVDEQEREMIESVIEFRDIHVGQIMTARPEIIGLELTDNLETVRQTIIATGHSRIPVYEGTLDKIVGVLYARDLLKYLGTEASQFQIRSVMRPVFYVPETKLLRDLLQDFRLQKIHIAIVLDEYGGTAGLVTIEDILEELVGEISDEHEPAEPAMLKRIDDRTTEADARIYIDELNRMLGLGIPEDAGFDTLGGFLTTTIGRIPECGAVFDYGPARYTILAAEPQKIDRVKIELLLRSPTPSEEPA